MLNEIWVSFLVFFGTVTFLIIYLSFSTKLQWFDKPNELRKLHDKAKPTSAGIIFVLPIIIYFLINPNARLLAINTPLIAYITLGMVVIGGIDDFKNLSAKLRLIVVLGLCYYFVNSIFAETKISLFLLGLYVLGMLWWINLYNFMDGADGMAALHAFITLFAYGSIFVTYNFPGGLLFPYFLIVLFSILAFLIFNFPKAKIFMGDSGSLSLGFLIAAFALYGIKLGIFDEILVISFHLVFIIDASLTLFARMKFKHKLTQAHSMHVYQLLIKEGIRHYKVSLIYALLTIVTVAIALFNYFYHVKISIKLLTLAFEIIILSTFWIYYHNKTKFKHLIR